MDFEKNQILTVEIVDITSEGEGIGKIDGYPFFVKDAVIGDVAQIRVVRAKKNYAYARLEKVITPSPFRVEPACSFHKQCGGCQIQAMSYSRQLEFKASKVKNNLVRIGGFDEEQIAELMEPIVGMDEPFHYRNKAQYPVGTDKEGNPVAGFYAGRTHNIIVNTDCSLGFSENKEILEIILSYMKKHHVSAYDEVTGKGLVRHVLIRKGYYSGEIMVCLVINCGEKKAGAGKEGRGDSAEKMQVKGNRALSFMPAQEELISALAQITGMTSISVSLNTEKTNVIMGEKIYTIWGEDVIHDTIHMRDVENNFASMGDVSGKGIEFSISPLSFYQVNPIQVEKLYSLALSYAGLTGKETVWDLYCGIGTISLFLAKGAKQIYGVEVIPQAIEDAKKNAIHNSIHNAEFFVGKAEEALPRKYEEEGISADVIVVDPPRKGCDEACLATMLKMKPDRIVYVSCDSATLARDLRVLCDGGYELKKVRAVDMFPMTVHVETVVLMSRVEK